MQSNYFPILIHSFNRLLTIFVIKKSNLAINTNKVLKHKYGFESNFLENSLNAIN